MQSMPLLFRRSIRSSLQFTRTSSRPLRVPYHPTTPNAFPVRTPTPRPFSVCLQCQFRSSLRSHAAFDEKDKGAADPANVAQDVKEVDSGKATPFPEVDAGAPRAAFSMEAEKDLVAEALQAKDPEKIHLDQQELRQRKEQADGTPSGGLPSYLESRRSQMSKQFSAMMDNLQSNVFVAGQRLNDLTGYSGIEALKNEIHTQETRLRTARAHVRQAKEDYSAAITRRSTSQREVNELLQRKHAWSPTDLERFTLLYRNDHTNEVAETETQEALSAAEREAEEAAAQLSKSILSRYHEEQVWSDKIRRMSTWGTWGLMGMNVLLFLIFQIAVEPWRRRRLVKGFEDKVVEAIEKEKALNQAAAAGGSAALSVTPTAAPLEESTSENTSTELIANKDAPVAAVEIPADTTPTTSAHPSQSLHSRLSDIPSPFVSLEYWRQAAHELFSDRSLALSQRDLTTVAIQSAAAGATVMGLVIALLRPN
ncbi:hypothetical protein NUU61_006824 [Penicillium alfredii]|uniref:Sensitive to high expression protein 9, mitochondrial n=1 Tax=Penicillium alfredii TaxID=1506179 RepID=A0A9W9F1N4_9EURO|nr:uncharacterized protein NUU61_006824 [Penicillium alfredii]KAJ5091954.1 hypothetical protein NUU61_006824 [Penicillium alfredii]